MPLGRLAQPLKVPPVGGPVLGMVGEAGWVGSPQQHEVIMIARNR